MLRKPTFPSQRDGVRTQMDHVSHETIYQENSQNWRYFLEWRHRILVRVFVAVAAMMLASRWLYQENLVGFLYVPALISSLLFSAAAVLDRRNAIVAKASREVGARLEEQSIDGGGFFANYPDNSGLISYTSVLKLTYISGAITFFGISIVLVILF